MALVGQTKEAALSSGSASTRRREGEQEEFKETKTVDPQSSQHKEKNHFFSLCVCVCVYETMDIDPLIVVTTYNLGKSGHYARHHKLFLLFLK